MENKLAGFLGNMKFVGLNVKKTKPINQNTNKILTTTEDGSTIFEGVGPQLNTAFWNSNFVFTEEIDLIKKFRDMSLNSYMNKIISEIVNTCISYEDETGCSISLDLDKLDIAGLSEETKTKMLKSWEHVLDILDFKNNGQSIFRDWYIDGRAFYQKIVNKNKLEDGIIEVRKLDALDIKKVKQIERKVDPDTGALIIEQEREFFLYSPQQDINYGMNQSVLLAPDSVAFSSSGLYVYKQESSSKINFRNSIEGSNRFIVSYLYPVIKPLNQLNIVEEAGLINMVSRSPDRRVHYVDIAGLPKAKGEQAIADYAKSIKNNLQYNANDGTFNSDSHMLSMQDDLIIPRRNGTNTAEVTSLPGVQPNNNLDIITYFKKKLYMASNVALSRMNEDGNSFLGRSSEINRDELNMSKFCNNLRMKFVELPLDIWRTDLILKNIIAPSDWDKIKGRVIPKYSSDTFISQLRELDLLNECLTALDRVNPYVGSYYSSKYVKKNILGMTDERIKQMQAEISEETPADQDIMNSQDNIQPQDNMETPEQDFNSML